MRITLSSQVSITGIRPEIAIAIQVVTSVYEDAGEKVLKINSVCNGDHSPASLHYVGFAVDIGFPVVVSKQLLVEALKACLKAEFDVVLEADHIHIEFQPKVPVNHYKWAGAESLSSVNN